MHRAQLGGQLRLRADDDQIEQPLRGQPYFVIGHEPEVDVAQIARSIQYRHRQVDYAARRIERRSRRGRSG